MVYLGLRAIKQLLLLLFHIKQNSKIADTANQKEDNRGRRADSNMNRVNFVVAKLWKFKD